LLSLVTAQETTLPTDHLWQLSFMKQNITWDWRGILTYNQESDNGPGIRLDERFISNLLIPGTFQRKWRDENNFNSFIFYKQSRNYYGIYLKSWSLTNKQTLLVSRYLTHSAGLRSVLEIDDQVVVTPYAGYQYSKNLSYIDWGYALGIDGKINQINMGDYKTDLYLSADYDLFPERENSANQFDIRINKRFSNVAEDSLSVSYQKSKQQYYSSSFKTIVDVNLETKSLKNVLDYNLSSRSFFQVNTILIDRQISDNTPANPNIRKVFRFENHFGYRYFSSGLFFHIGLNTYLETLDNVDIRTDSEALQTGITTDFSFFFNNNNQLDVELNFIKYQFDTPDMERNFDDRDEIRFVGIARYLHHLSPLLSLEFAGYVNLFHKSYIFGQQSANNNWNRIYRIQAMVHYNYSKFSNTLRTEVLANFTAYDFDYLFDNTRSFIFRRYSVSDSMMVPLLDQVYAGVYVRLELEDRGDFYKDLFAQNIVESSQILYYDYFFRKVGLFNLNFEIGFAVYHRKNWRHLAVAVETRDIRRVSPYIRLVYPLGRNLQFSSQIAQNYLVDLGREKNQYTYGRLDLHYFF
jgi:hypothetical protein